MRNPKHGQLRRLGADPDVSRMIATVLQQHKMASIVDLPEAEVDMLIELAGDMSGQLDGAITTPPADRSYQ